MKTGAFLFWVVILTRSLAQFYPFSQTNANTAVGQFEGESSIVAKILEGIARYFL
ncbi:hypothetical protein SAMN05444972_108119 [Marininema halotolerans]|uniref:Uncharacterized protein n=1 Tax=Marininema halotolerans TaxID=1155944 RepID=A0A1I6SXY1_9BACL|nr:hypothetical protein SAMN05444972_108119 [Marininema halotolerans]